MMDKYKQYVELQWWNGIEKRDIENWIRNFGSSKNLAQLILDNVIFYSSTQIKAYTRFLVNELKKQVYVEVMKDANYYFVEDEKFIHKWNEYINETKFIPAALINDPTASAHRILCHWRVTLEKGDEPFSILTDIDNNYYKGIKRFVLVDDFSGSGAQMIEVLKQKVLLENKEYEIGKIFEADENIEIVVAVYVIHENAIRALKNKYPKIKILYVDLITEELNYLNEKSIFYENLDDNQKRRFIEEIRKLNSMVMNDNEELKKLSSYVLNIPVVFEHGCPNNTLLLLFAHSNGWQQLFKRGEEI